MLPAVCLVTFRRWRSGTAHGSRRRDVQPARTLTEWRCQPAGCNSCQRERSTDVCCRPVSLLVVHLMKKAARARCPFVSSFIASPSLRVVPARQRRSKTAVIVRRAAPYDWQIARTTRSAAHVPRSPIDYADQTW